MNFNSNFNLNNSQSAKLIGKTTILLNTVDNSYLFNDIEIFSDPNTSLYLNFSYKFPLYPDNLYENKNSLNEKNEFYSILIKITTPPCKRGEIFNNKTLTCDECKENYYSINPFDLQCNPCPLNAYCPGRDKIAVYANFWKMNNSVNIYECDSNIGNCIGGELSLCNSNYMGILCLNCIGTMQKNYIGICEVCPNIYLNIFSNLCVYVFGMIMLTIILLYYNNKQVSKEKKRIFTIFINYVHFLFLTQKFNRNPYQSSLEIYVFLKIAFWFSLDCLLNTIIPGDNFLLITIVKLFIFYFSLFVFALMALTKKQKMIKIFVIFYYSIYPFFLIFLLDNMVCQNIENYYILKTTANIDCSSILFQFFIGLIGVPNILFVCLIVPMYYLRKQYQNIKRKYQAKHKFQSSIIQFSYFRYFLTQKFFTMKFGKNLSELLIFLEKTLLIFSQEFFSSDIMKLLSSFFVVFFILLIQIIVYQVNDLPQSSIFYLSKTVILINVYFFIILSLNYTQTLAFIAVSVASLLKARLYFIFFVSFFRKDISISKIRPKIAKDSKILNNVPSKLGRLKLNFKMITKYPKI